MYYPAYVVCLGDDVGNGGTDVCDKVCGRNGDLKASDARTDIYTFVVGGC